MPHFATEALSYAVDQLIISCVPSLAAKLHMSGLHAGCLGVITDHIDGFSIHDASLQRIAQRVIRILYLLKENEAIFLGCTSYATLLRAFWEHGHGMDTTIVVRDSDTRSQAAIAVMCDVLWKLMGQYFIFRSCLAGVMSSQIRNITRNIRSHSQHSRVLIPASSFLGPVKSIAPAPQATSGGSVAEDGTSATLSTVLTSASGVVNAVGNPAGARFNLADYDWVGFDLDHTLIEYKVSEFNVHMAKAAVRYILETAAGHVRALLESTTEEAVIESTFSQSITSMPNEHKFILCAHLLLTGADAPSSTPNLRSIYNVVSDPAAIQRTVDALNFHKTTVTKCSVLDVTLGNVLQLSPNASVVAGSHGSRSLTPDELLATYGSAPLSSYACSEAAALGLLSKLHSKPTMPKANEQYLGIHTGFDQPLAVLLSHLVDAHDAMAVLTSSASSISASEEPSALHHDAVESAAEHDPTKLTSRSTDSRPGGDTTSEMLSDACAIITNTSASAYCVLASIIGDALLHCFSKFCPYGVSSIWSNLSNYVHKSPEVKQLLTSLKNLPLPPRHNESGVIAPSAPNTRKRIRVFMITNAAFEHADLLMKYAVDENWLDYFDLVVCDSKKRSFFTRPEPKQPFKMINTRTGRVVENRSDASSSNIWWTPQGSTTKVRHSTAASATAASADVTTASSPAAPNILNLHAHRVYSGGNLSELMSTFAGFCYMSADADGARTATTLHDPIPPSHVSVCFIGDHVWQDVVAPASVGWDVVAVVGELLNEIAAPSDDHTLVRKFYPQNTGLAQAVRTAAFVVPSVALLSRVFVRAMQAAQSSADAAGLSKLSMARCFCDNNSSNNSSQTPRPAAENGGFVQWVVAAFSRKSALDPHTYTAIMGKCVRACRATVNGVHREFSIRSVSALLRDAHQKHMGTSATGTSVSSTPRAQSTRSSLAGLTRGASVRSITLSTGAKQQEDAHIWTAIFDTVSVTADGVRDTPVLVESSHGVVSRASTSVAGELVEDNISVVHEEPSSRKSGCFSWMGGREPRSVSPASRSDGRLSRTRSNADIVPTVLDKSFAELAALKQWFLPINIHAAVAAAVSDAFEANDEAFTLFSCGPRDGAAVAGGGADSNQASGAADIPDLWRLLACAV